MDQPTSFDIRKILDLLPHRYPFLLVDRVNEIVDGEHIKAHMRDPHRTVLSGAFSRRPGDARRAHH